MKGASLHITRPLGAINDRSNRNCSKMVYRKSAQRRINRGYHGSNGKKSASSALSAVKKNDRNSSGTPSKLRSERFPPSRVALWHGDAQVLELNERKLARPLDDFRREDRDPETNEAICNRRIVRLLPGVEVIRHRPGIGPIAVRLNGRLHEEER